jgi:hypothetical protein
MEDFPTFRFLASAAKDHFAHPITQAFDFRWIGGASKTLGEVEKFLLFALFSFHAVLDEFQQHPVGAKPARFSQGANLSSEGLPVLN